MIATYSILDFFRLRDHPGIVNGGCLQICDNPLCFFNVPMSYKPSRRFWQPRNSCIQNEDEQELKGKWESPAALVNIQDLRLVNEPSDIPSHRAVDKREAISDPSVWISLLIVRPRIQAVKDGKGYQLESENPAMFRINSITTSFPLQLACEVSACQTGAVAVFSPLPIPATIRPTIICGTL